MHSHNNVPLQHQSNLVPAMHSFVCTISCTAPRNIIRPHKYCEQSGVTCVKLAQRMSPHSWIPETLGCCLRAANISSKATKATCPCIKAKRGFCKGSALACSTSCSVLASNQAVGVIQLCIQACLGSYHLSSQSDRTYLGRCSYLCGYVACKCVYIPVCRPFHGKQYLEGMVVLCQGCQQSEAVAGNNRNLGVAMPCVCHSLDPVCLHQLSTHLLSQAERMVRQLQA